MKLRNYLFVFFLTVSSLFGQTPYNAVGYGLFIDQVDAASFGLGTAGFVPSFNSVSSIGNPSTWSELMFTYLSSHYNTGTVEFLKQGGKSYFGRLINSVFIIPIKQKYAFGLGIRPLTRKKFYLNDSDLEPYVFSGDTISVSKNIKGSGGISSFYIAGSWKYHKNTTFAVQWDFLLGTFSEVTTSTLSNSSYPFVYQRSLQFNGTLLSLFLKQTITYLPIKSAIFLMYQLPTGTIKLSETDYHPFEDIDRNKVHSSQDNPNPFDIDAITKTHTNFSYPTTIKFGFTGNLSEKHFVLFEYVLRRCEGIKEWDYLHTLKSEKSNISFTDDERISIGYLKEGDPKVRNIFKKLHFRFGIFQQKHYIFGFKGISYERGFSFGLGIPFGLTHNQLDIGCRISERDGFLVNERERIIQGTAGITIGDIWLVKGRRR